MSKLEFEENKKEQEVDRIAELEKKLELLLAEKQEKSKETTVEEKIEQLLQERIKKYELDKQQEIINARKTIAEAEEQDRIEQELKENQKFQLKKDLIARKEEELRQACEQVKYMLQNNMYRHGTFDSRNNNEELNKFRMTCRIIDKLGAEYIIKKVKEQATKPKGLF